MLEFLRTNQLNIMLLLSGICAMLAFFAYFAKSLSAGKRLALLLTEAGTALLLVADRFSYIYRGDMSALGYWMVRICNFAVYFMILFVTFSFNLYLKELFTREAERPVFLRRLRAADVLTAFAAVLLIANLFFGFYYTFDAANRYQRAPGFVASYVLPLLILLFQASVIIQYYKCLSRTMRLSLLLFSLLPLLAGVAQIFAYGLSLINITVGVMSVTLYLFALLDMNEAVERANRIEIAFLREEKESMSRLFRQTALALVNAIDAKDAYTHGHSSRVAEYSRMIARLAGKTEKECNEIYYAALLHDVGKIGISDAIINKAGRLTAEEYEVIKQHPVMGRQILSSIGEYPYLSIGANYHHERYDGRGYPEKLKGEDIPETARIIAVADAYDAMTSKRSYRDPIPQQKVREEFVKGSGAQFDPKFAKIMLRLIDQDTEYRMRETESVRELAGKNTLECGAYRSAVSEGILITPNTVSIHLKCVQAPDIVPGVSMPSLLLFDSLDGRVHKEERKQAELCYFEYGEIRFDGRTVCTGARKMESEIVKEAAGAEEAKAAEYDVAAARYRDHLLIQISGRRQTLRVTVALPDSTRYAYIGLTGERCLLSNVSIRRAEAAVRPGDIPRIAEEITYIDVPAGDIPNLQVDGYRTAATDGVPVTDGMSISFHTMSLPTARLVWHCPYIDLFYSDDGRIGGPNYREFALIRLDGENWESDGAAENKLIVNKNDSFEGWDGWKESNKRGYDCSVTFRRKGLQIVTTTENAGIGIRCVTTINGETKAVYAALTGDQCALTDIRIKP